MTEEGLLTCVADIVLAHLKNNKVTSGQLPQLIESVYVSLGGLGKTALVIENKPKPAVSIRSSVKPDAIVCLECGARLKLLKRHLETDHQITPAAYKARWNLDAAYPLVAPEYAAMRRNIATKIGLGSKLGAKAKSPDKGKSPAQRMPRLVLVAGTAAKG